MEYRVDTSKGSTNSAVQSQWFSRPNDQKFLSITDLYKHVKYEADLSKSNIIDFRTIKTQTSTKDPNTLKFLLPTSDVPIEAEATHWSFGQMATLLGAPAGYLRKLPATIAGINLQYMANNFRSEMVKTYIRQNGKTEIRAVTGPEYGRILDAEVVEAVQKIAGNGIGDTHWKVPGVLNWQKGTYNPDAPITIESTTLFASDRDVFMFLVDDRRPIEIGTLPDGSPDLVFRGFYVWNSEVGSKTFGIATFYLRGVCQNRMLWGVEGYNKMVLKHSKNAPMRFSAEAAPILEAFSNTSTERFIEGVKTAKTTLVAKTDDDRETFLTNSGFTKSETKKIIESVLSEEQKAPESIWDFVQGITAVARTQGHQDHRIDMEKKAGKLLDSLKVA